MAKEPSGAAKRGDRILRVKPGETVEFPVPAKHPLARFQTITPVRSTKDVVAFLPMWEKAAASRDQPAVPARLVAQLKQHEIGVLHIAADAFEVPARATVRLNNPLCQIDCADVTIAGDVVVTGDLVLTCNSLTLE